MKCKQPERVWHWLSRAAFAALLLWLVLEGVYRMGFVWLIPMREEVSLLHYMAWLVDQKNFVPYQDVFETAFPGSLLFHITIGRVFGYSDHAFHVVDWLWLSALLWVTWKILRIFSARIAWVGVAAFFATYYQHGAAMTLQRDYVGLLPIALSLWLALYTPWHWRWRAGLMGLLLAIAASMKPHLLLATPVLLYVLLFPAVTVLSWRLRVELLLIGLGGFFSGIFLLGLWLYRHQGLQPFVAMVTEYLPLYMGDDGIRTAVWMGLRTVAFENWIDAHIPQDLGGTLPIRSGAAWQMANIGGTLLEALLSWLLWIVGGAYCGLRKTQRGSQARQLVIALLCLCGVFWLYPVLANKYWNYHWMPYRYFVLLCGVLVLLPATKKTVWTQSTALIALAWLAWLLAGKLPPASGEKPLDVLSVWYQRGFAPERYPEHDLAAFLRQHLRAGETVQVLDEGGIAMHALLEAQALPATPYLSYRQLLVNENTLLVQQMREQLMARLMHKPPQLIIDTHTAPRADFYGAPYQFPALDALLRERYHTVMNQCNAVRCFLTIWERNP